MVVGELGETYVGKQIRRSNRNMAIGSMILIMMSLVFLLGNRHYFYNFFWGPFDITAAQLYQVASPQAVQNYFVRFSVSALKDTGYSEVNTKTNQTAAYYYIAFIAMASEGSASAENSGIGSSAVFPVLLKLNGYDEKVQRLAERMDNLFYLKLNADEQFFKGALVEIPEKVREGLPAEVLNKFGKVQPFMIDATDFRLDGYIGLSVAAFLMGLGFWGLFLVLRRSNQFSLHPLGKALSRVGHFEEMVIHVENELQNVHDTKVFSTVSKACPLKMTKNWFFCENYLGVRVMNLADIVWFYERRMNRFSYVTLYDCLGRKVELACKADQVSAILEEFAKRCPLAIWGYSRALQKEWKSNRSSFIAKFGAKKSEHSSLN